MSSQSRAFRFRRALRRRTVRLVRSARPAPPFSDLSLHNLSPLEPRVLLTTLSLIATDAKAAESGGPPTDKGTITFMLDTPAATDIQIDYTVTGTAGTSDFTALPGGITILQGQKSATLSIAPVDDVEKEGPETVIVSTDGAVGVTLNQSKSSATVTIADNESTVSVTASKAAANEVNPTTTGKGTFTFTRTGGSLALDLIVNFTLAGTATPTTDFTLGGNVTDLGGFFSVTIPATKASVTVDVTPVGDAIADAGETVVVDVVNRGVPGPDGIMVVNTYGIDANKHSATVTIGDAAPVVSIVKTKDASENNPATTGKGVFTITRTGPTTAPMTVRFSIGGTANGPGNYSLSTTAAGGLGVDMGFTTVTIPAGKSSVTVDLTPVDDAVADLGDTVVLTLAQDVALTYNVSPTKGSATVTIADNEPTVSVAASKAAASETDPATTGKGTFTFTRAVGPTTAPLTVHYTVTGTADADDDYTALTGTAIILAGKTSVTVDVIPVDDPFAEATETVIVTLDTNSAYNVNPLPAKQTATVNIADNEPVVTVTASKPAASETNPGTTGKGTFTFTRAGGSTAADLTVLYNVTGTATPDDDYPALPGMVVIPAGKTSITVDVIPVDDATAEDPETVIVTLATGMLYNLNPMVAKRTGTVTIADNEPKVSIAKTKDGSEANGTTTGKGVFTVTRTGGDLTQPLTVHYTVDNASTATADDDYTALSGDVVIPANKTTATIDVLVNPDTEIDPNETVIVNLAADAAYHLDTLPAKRTATVKITDVAAIDLLETLGLNAVGNTWHYAATLHDGSSGVADTVVDGLTADSWQYTFNITPDNPDTTALSPTLTVLRSNGRVQLGTIGVGVDGIDVNIDFDNLDLGPTTFTGSVKSTSPITINLLGSLLNGTATSTNTLVGTQSVTLPQGNTVPPGNFTADKLTLAISFTASGLVPLGPGGDPINLTVAGSVNFTFFAVPGIGIVKLITVGTVKVTEPGVGTIPLNLGFTANLLSLTQIM